MSSLSKMSSDKDTTNSTTTTWSNIPLDGSSTTSNTDNGSTSTVVREEKVSDTRRKISNIFTILSSGFALMSDGYQSSLMTMVNVVFKRLYPSEYSADVATRVSNALLIGAIAGQIVIGFACDRMGRKTAIILTTLMIIVGGSLATGAVGLTPAGMFWMMTVARGVVGFGVGGEYPASSTSASEAANDHDASKRGPIFIMVTNLPQSLGSPMAIAFFLVCLAVFGNDRLDVVWRTCMGFGVLLPLAIFYFRVKMLNTKMYEKSAIKGKVPYKLVLSYYWKSLIGTCGAWFLYDFVTFPNCLFSASILDEVVPKGPDGAASLMKTGLWQMLLGSFLIPGVLIGAYMCDRPGRKNTMMIGFLGYVVFGLVIGLAYDKITAILPLFVVLYGLMQCFGNLGPGDMLGLLSSESYATSVRGTAYGISAAVGKSGAAVGVQVFALIQDTLGTQATFIIVAICGLAGILVTYFFIPNITAEDLSVRDGKFETYLIDNGWEGKMGVPEEEKAIDALENV